MELIDRYVAEVGRQLPSKTRADIEGEIRSTLEDMLEDRSQKAGRPADEALVCEVLKEYGSPEKVAAAYLPPRYLIGPRIYPIFELVLRVVLAVIVGVGLLRLGMSVVPASPTPEAFMQFVAKALLDMAASALSALGNIVLVFAILDRTMVNVKMTAESWDPRTLPAVSEPERVKPGEIILEVVFSLGVVLVLNFYPQIIRIAFFNHGAWTFIPVLSEAFFRYLPWINVACGLQIVQNLILLRQGRWQLGMRLFSVVVDVFGMGLAYAMLTGPALIHLTAAELEAAGPFGAQSAGVVATMTNASVSLALAVALIVSGVEVARTLYTLVVKRRGASPAAA